MRIVAAERWELQTLGSVSMAHGRVEGWKGGLPVRVEGVVRDKRLNLLM